MKLTQQRYLQAVSSRLGQSFWAGDDKMRHYILKCAQGVIGQLLAETRGNEYWQQHNRPKLTHIIPQLSEIFATNKQQLAVVETLKTLLQTDTSPAATIEAELIKLLNALMDINDKPLANTLLQQLVCDDADQLIVVEERYNELTQLANAPVANNSTQALSEQQCERLLQLLIDNCNEAKSLAINAIKLIPGGYSKQTVLVELQHNTQLPQHIVLRIDRPESPLGSTVIAEYPLLKALAEANVKVPTPWAIDNDNVSGAPLMVVSRVEGDTIADGFDVFDPKNRQHCGISLAIEMAKFHNISADQLPPNLPGKGQSNIEATLTELKAMETLWQQCGQPSRTVQGAFSWLYKHIDYAGEHACLTHRDLRFHNILVNANGVAALIDWELAAYGNPGIDIAYVYHHIKQIMPWQNFLNAYRDAGGALPSSNTLAFYALRTDLFSAVYLRKITAGFTNGDFDNIEMAYAGSHMQQYSMYLLAQKMKAFIAGDLTL